MKLLKERRSIRSFKDDEVSKDQINKLIEAAVWAPSGGNIQAWKVMAVKGKPADDIKRFSPGLLGDPPVLLVICTNKEEALEKGGELGRDVLGLMDVAIAAQNICLQATSMNLGTCIVRSFNQNAVQKILELPEDIVPELIISVGIPEKIPGAPPKREPEDVVKWMGWNDD